MSADSGAQSLRVLVIEDEPLVAMLLEDMIADAGHQVAGVIGDLGRALAHVADADDFDVVVMDVNLSGEPIFPVADVLARRGKSFAFSTGYGRGGLPEAWRDRPVLSKPFGSHGVAEMLRGLAAG